jgi:hypothetical protein
LTIHNVDVASCDVRRRGATPARTCDAVGLDARRGDRPLGPVDDAQGFPVGLLVPLEQAMQEQIGAPGAPP